MEVNQVLTSYEFLSVILFITVFVFTTQSIFYAGSIFPTFIYIFGFATGSEISYA